MSANLSAVSYLPRFLQRLFVQETNSPSAFAVLDPALVERIRQADVRFRAATSPARIQALNGRLERGLDLALKGAVQLDPLPGQPDHCRVRSSDGTQYYEVDLENRTCTCPDSLKGNTCKHRIAAYYVLEATRPGNGQQGPKSDPTIPPTCSVPPEQARSKPTCSITPTRSEFEKAEKRSTPSQSPQKPDPASKSPVPSQPIQPPAKPQPAHIPVREAQILKELGFDSAPQMVGTTALQSHPRLGSLYRRYLHGEDLNQQPYKVTIADITQETVRPHPTQPAYQKWCLWVKGLPQGVPAAILFGAQGEKELVSIFGRVDLNTIIGKSVVVYPQAVSVAGQQRIMIRFRGVQ